MGWSSKKSTASQQSTSTTTPNVPQWGVDSLKGLNDQIQAIAGTNPSNFVAPASALQQQAATGAANLGGWRDTSGQATNLANTTAGAATPQTSAATAYGGISNYLNPELENVVKTTLADFDQGAGETRARQASAGAQANAFGGSRFGIQEGETEGQLARARATADATLRSNAYTDAEGQAQQDAQRAQSANNENATLGSEALNRNAGIAGLLQQVASQNGESARQDVATQGAAGDTMRAIDQSSRTAPISLAQTVAQLLQGNQLDLLTGKTTNSSGTSTQTSTPSTADQIKDGVNTAIKLAELFSDRRLKRDIERVGTRPDGLGVYAYRYLWSPLRFVGVMAQEVLKVKPEAVRVHPSGFLMVNYGAL